MNSNRDLTKSLTEFESKQLIAAKKKKKKRSWSPGMYVCIQIRTYTHVGRPDILFVHKIKRSQESDMVVEKANAALRYTDG